MQKPSTYSELKYLSDYFLSDRLRLMRRIGIRLWLLQLLYEIGFKVRYPKFKYLYKLYPRDLDVDKESQIHSVQYETVSHYTLLTSLKKVGDQVKDKSKCVFIDVGCGAGKVLFQAFRTGFQVNIGIDQSARLCELSNQNLSNHDVPPSRFEIVNSDIRNVDLQGILDRHKASAPLNVVVFFLNNPFDVEILQIFIRQVTALRGFDVFVLYVWKQYPEVLVSRGFVILEEELRKGRFTLDSFRIYQLQKLTRGEQ